MEVKHEMMELLTTQHLLDILNWENGLGFMKTVYCLSFALYVNSAQVKVTVELKALSKNGGLCGHIMKR